jgi:hypothetical protein
VSINGPPPSFAHKKFREFCLEFEEVWKSAMNGESEHDEEL